MRKTPSRNQRKSKIFQPTTSVRLDQRQQLELLAQESLLEMSNQVHIEIIDPHISQYRFDMGILQQIEQQKQFKPDRVDLKKQESKVKIFESRKMMQKRNLLTARERKLPVPVKQNSIQQIGSQKEIQESQQILLLQTQKPVAAQFIRSKPRIKAIEPLVSKRESLRQRKEKQLKKLAQKESFRPTALNFTNFVIIDSRDSAEIESPPVSLAQRYRKTRSVMSNHSPVKTLPKTVSTKMIDCIQQSGVFDINRIGTTNKTNPDSDRLYNRLREILNYRSRIHHLANSPTRNKK